MRSISSLCAAAIAAGTIACGDAESVVAPAHSSDVLIPSLVRGAQVAQRVCAQCHGSTFEGGKSGSATCPALSAVRNYSQASFDRLLLTGIAANGETIGEAMLPARALDEEDRQAVYLYFVRIVDTP